MSNSDGILVIFVIDIILSLVVGGYVEFTEKPEDGRIGFYCVTPGFFAVNLVGIFALEVLKWIGVLGPWWSWILGIAVPYILIGLFVWFTPEDAEKRHRNRSPF